MQWCLQNYKEKPDEILSPEAYQKILQYCRQPLLDRLNHFYSTRGKMMSSDIDAWRALNTPFQPIWQALIERGGERVVLLTNKNRKAVANLCRHFNLNILDENIYSGDEGATKIQNFKSIFDRFPDLPYLFLDDSIKNLRLIDHTFNSTKSLISLLFANWGYSGPNDREIAKTSGYQLLSQEDIIEMLDTELLPLSH
jgi:FMN phosphatase YigB (HAD superfamily)